MNRCFVIEVHDSDVQIHSLVDRNSAKRIRHFTAIQSRFADLSRANGTSGRSMLRPQTPRSVSNSIRFLQLAYNLETMRNLLFPKRIEVVIGCVAAFCFNILLGRIAARYGWRLPAFGMDALDVGHIAQLAAA